MFIQKNYLLLISLTFCVLIVNRHKKAPFGWAKYWKKHWNEANRDFLTILGDLHRAEPPELTSYVEGDHMIRNIILFYIDKILLYLFSV